MKRKRLNSEEEEDEESHVKVIGNKIIFYGDVTNKSCFGDEENHIILPALDLARK